jgi:hypothetical protein
VGSPRDEFFVLVSFEGPDLYAAWGGLSERVLDLASRTVSEGFETHLIYFGAPHLPGMERVLGSRLTLHRWGQWLSAGFPGGVYEGEDAKRRELAASLPPFLVDTLIRPGTSAGFRPTILAEEWQTADFVCALAARLSEADLRPRVRLIWRTGSLHGLSKVDWETLRDSAEIGATDARIQEALAEVGVDARVFPANPAALLDVLSPGRWKVPGQSRPAPSRRETTIGAGKGPTHS